MIVCRRWRWGVPAYFILNEVKRLLNRAYFKRFICNRSALSWIYALCKWNMGFNNATCSLTFFALELGHLSVCVEWLLAISITMAHVLVKFGRSTLVYQLSPIYKSTVRSCIDSNKSLTAVTIGLEFLACPVPANISSRHMQYQSRSHRHTQCWILCLLISASFHKKLSAVRLRVVSLLVPFCCRKFSSLWIPTFKVFDSGALCSLGSWYLFSRLIKEYLLSEVDGDEC